MKRRAMMAGMVGGVLAVPHLVSGQSPSSRRIPTRTGLAQLGLERHWFNIIPMASGSARVAGMNLTNGYLFAQTTDGLVVCYNAETGQRLWMSNLQTVNLTPAAISVNDRMAIAAVGQKVLGLELTTGAKIWESKLENLASGGTAVNSKLAIAAVKSGKVQVFNVEDQGLDTCGERHDPVTCRKLKPSVGSYLYAWQTDGGITSKPLMNEKFMVFSSLGGKDSSGKFRGGQVYLASLKERKIVFRFETKGPIRGNMGLYGTSQVIVGSDDHKIYSIDLFEPEKADTNWIFPTDGPVNHDILVAGDDIFAVTSEGHLYALNGKDGSEKWQLPIGKAKILAITPTRLYGVTVDGGPAVVNRQSGQVEVTPEQGIQSFGVDLKNFPAQMTNNKNDRIYLASEDGILLCLRELGKVDPTPLRDPKLPRFGITPQEMYEKEQAAQEKAGKPADKPSEPAEDEKAEPKAGAEPK